MATHKSVIQDFELKNGYGVYAQISGSGRGTLSFDSKHTQFSLWLEVEEMTELADLLTKAVKEWQDGQASQE